uniref:ORF4 n=1 Tax=Bemisia tabaci negevirus 1 TaxID=2840074 RepID=A0A8E8FTP7_9VIRU|nr:ORF4 [Bemisia tabaci negevirus 1]
MYLLYVSLLLFIPSFMCSPRDCTEPLLQQISGLRNKNNALAVEVNQLVVKHHNAQNSKPTTKDLLMSVIYLSPNYTSSKRDKVTTQIKDTLKIKLKLYNMNRRIIRDLTHQVAECYRRRLKYSADRGRHLNVSILPGPRETLILTNDDQIMDARPVDPDYDKPRNVNKELQTVANRVAALPLLPDGTTPLRTTRFYGNSQNSTPDNRRFNGNSQNSTPDNRRFKTSPKITNSKFNDNDEVTLSDIETPRRGYNY